MNTKFVKSLFIFSALALSMMLVACGSSTSGNNDDVVEIQPITGNALSIMFYDVGTGKIITSEVEVDLEGSLISESSLESSGNTTSTTTTDGLINFYTNDDGYLKISASAENYVPGVKIVNVDATTTLVKVGLALATNSAEDGVTVAQTSGLISSGSLSTNVSAGGLSITSGTGFSAGSANLRGSVDITLTSFAIDNSVALQALPTLWLETSANNYSPIIAGAAFQLAVIDGNGLVADEADEDMEITFSLPAGLINPLTGTAVAAGDNLLTFQLGSDGWVAAGSVEISAGDNGLEGSFSFTESGYWVIGWVTDGCVEGVSVTMPDDVDENIFMTLSGAEGQWSQEISSLGGTSFTFYNTPDDGEAVLTLVQNSRVVVAEDVALSCGASVSPEAELTGSFFSLRAVVSGQCDGEGTGFPIEGVLVSVLQDGTPADARRTGPSGEVLFSLTADLDYEVVVFDQNNEASVVDLTLDGGKSAEFAVSVDCTEITGAEGN